MKYLTYLMISLLSSVFIYADCTLNFSFDESWKGADAAYSLPISNNRTLWLFGDTFTRHDENEFRSFNGFVSNSIGISDCNGSIKYFYGIENSDFFAHPNKSNGYKYWPKAGVKYKDSIFVFLLEVETSKGGALGFIESGTVVAKISNIYDNPLNWEIDYIDISTSYNFFPGTALSIVGNELFSLSTLVTDNNIERPILLLSFSLDEMLKNKVKVKALFKNDKWYELQKNELENKKFIIKNFKQVMSSASTEMSISYNRDLSKWIAIYSDAPLLRPSIVARTADVITGPWSEQKVIFSYPEMNPRSDMYTKDIFCYAGKEQKEFYDFKDMKLRVSYVCNSFSIDEILSNENIYIPKFIDVPLRQL